MMNRIGSLGAFYLSSAGVQNVRLTSGRLACMAAQHGVLWKTLPYLVVWLT